MVLLNSGNDDYRLGIDSIRSTQKPCWGIEIAILKRNEESLLTSELACPDISQFLSGNTNMLKPLCTRSIEKTVLDIVKSKKFGSSAAMKRKEWLKIAESYNNSTHGYTGNNSIIIRTPHEKFREPCLNRFNTLFISGVMCKLWADQSDHFALFSLHCYCSAHRPLYWWGGIVNLLWYLTAFNRSDYSTDQLNGRIVVTGQNKFTTPLH